MKKLSFPREKMRIVLLENIHQSAESIFEKEGFVIERISGSLGEAELIEKLQDAHIIGIRSKTELGRTYFEASKRLLAVGCFCIGTNQVDLRAAKIKGVPVFNAPFSNTRSVAEMILAEIVMLSRKLGDRNRELHAGKWKKSASDCYEIRGKTLGIIGYGKIGSQVSVLAESFGMNVVFYDIVSKMPMGNSSSCTDLENLFLQSDFVSLHVPETEATKNMIGLAELKKMKKGAYLLNASRGSVVDLEALKNCLLEKHLAGAAIDVFPKEPSKNDDVFEHPLQGIENVILTPHIGGSTEEAQLNIGIEVATALSNFINEGSTSTAVNFPSVEPPKHEKVHRILNIHRNVPGVLAEINALVSEVGANIQHQLLATDPEIGYLVMDLNQDLSESVKDRISKMPANIRTRILY